MANGGQIIQTAELLQRVQRIQCGFAGGHNTDTRIRCRFQHAVQAVLVRKFTHAIQAGVQRTFHGRGQEFAGVVRVFAALLVGQGRGQIIQRGNLERAAAFHGFGNGFEGHPGAGVTRQGPGPDTKAFVFFNRAGVDHRDAPGDQGLFAGVGNGRGRGHVIITHNHQDATVLGGTGSMAVVQGIARAVYTGALAIPHGEHAIDGTVGTLASLLGAHNHGGGQVFVNSGLETNLGLVQILLGLPHDHVHATQRRTTVAGDKTGGVQTVFFIQASLGQQHAHQGLCAS